MQMPQAALAFPDSALGRPPLTGRWDRNSPVFSFNKGSPVAAEARVAPVQLHPLSTYTPEFAEKIFNLLEAGWSLNKICKEGKAADPTFPIPQTVRRWVRTIPEFAERYALARKNQLEYLADEILDISSDESRDSTPEGKPNSSAVNRDRLRVDTIKFLLVHLMPEKYGTLVKNEVTGKDGEPLQAIDLESLARRIAFETSKPKTEV